MKNPLTISTSRCFAVLIFFVSSMSNAAGANAAAAKPKKNLCERSFDKEVVVVAKKMKVKKDPQRWTRYGNFLKKFSGCIDGTFAQTVQAISEDGLAHDWEAFGKYIAKKKNRDEAILKHIKAGFNPDMSKSKDIEVIHDNARNKCPPVIKEFCDEIVGQKI